MGAHDTGPPRAFQHAPAAPPGRHAGGCRMSFEQQVRAVLEELRPMLRMDGGDIAFVAADESTGRVEVHLQGACRTCAASMTTMSLGVEARLKERIPTVREVVNV